MKTTFDTISAKCSKLSTTTYSTSFSFGTRLLPPTMRPGIYGIYGFVRFADEIVDSFHNYDQRTLLLDFRQQTLDAIEKRISLNPILNSFQEVVHIYNIDLELIDAFLHSMEMDLVHRSYNREQFEEYVRGSAEVVGLMCLRVFTKGDERLYEELKPAAIRLGAAFQKVNFLRDAKEDLQVLGRKYFPSVDPGSMTISQLRSITEEITLDFDIALQGIRRLPAGARRGVYVAYSYYRKLFRKLNRAWKKQAMPHRVRISNRHKLSIMFGSILRHQLNML